MANETKEEAVLRLLKEFPNDAEAGKAGKAIRALYNE